MLIGSIVHPKFSLASGFNLFMDDKNQHCNISSDSIGLVIAVKILDDLYPWARILFSEGVGWCRQYSVTVMDTTW